MFYSDEHQQDPSLKPSDSSDHPSIIQQETNDLERERPLDKKRKETQPTGEHPHVRSTGTDTTGLEIISDGEENNTQSLQRQEPDDPLPDQLDRNK